ncbi:MAG: transporter, partial [Mucilaginibacter sp.]|nr:transporter [Mucilaginibacter sp.]
MLPLFFASHISVKFFNNTLFNDLSFSVSKGENWAITGNSGSGKSVLLQIVA